MTWSLFISLYVAIFVNLANFCQAFNITLQDGSTYLGETNELSKPHGFGKLIKDNGDIYE